MPRRLPADGEPISEYLTVRRGLFYGDGFIQTSTIMAPTELLRRVPFTVGLRRQQELDWTLRAVRQRRRADLRRRAAGGLAPGRGPAADQPGDARGSSSCEWLRGTATLFTPRAYAAFTMSVLSSMAAPTRSPRVFRELLARPAGTAGPAPIDYLTYLQIWALPPSCGAACATRGARRAGRRSRPGRRGARRDAGRARWSRSGAVACCPGRRRSSATRAPR